MISATRVAYLEAHRYHAWYRRSRFRETPWFFVEVEVWKLDGNEDLVERLRDNRFEAYLKEDDSEISVSKSFSQASEAAAWIAEVATALKVSPYPDRWPFAGADWGEWRIRGREYFEGLPGYSWLRRS